jgi:nitrous oxidase accessory protein
MRRALLVPAFAAATLLGLTGVRGGGVPRPRANTSTAAPPRPASCSLVAPGADLQTIVDRAPEHSALCLTSGAYAAPLRLSRAVTVWGPRDAVIRSSGQGTTVSVVGSGVTLLGVTVAGSGHRYDLLDSGVHVEGAEDVRIEGITVDRATFGIMVDRSHRVTVRGCSITGLDEATLGLRGDGIRFWETTDSLIENNQVAHARDLVVWYSVRNRILGNLVEKGRYGTHLMYSSDNVVRDNRYFDDEVGIFVMYSRDVRLKSNVIAGGTGAAGMGIGIKESGNLRVEDNRMIRDTTGLYLDSTPLQPSDANVFEGNVVQLSDVGVAFHSSQRRNTFRGNVFRDNGTQVRVDGGGNALGVTWFENDFDDYAGYDMDGDGYGDVPYEPKSLSGELTATYPDLGFFHGSPTLAVLELAGRVVPILTPRSVLVDPRPALRGPRQTEESRAD